MRRIRTSALLAAAAVAALLLSGCLWLEQGSVVLTQPGGIGDVHLRFVVCSVGVEGEGENAKLTCGSGEEAAEAQYFAGLVVPTGAAMPDALEVSPGPGAAPMTLTRNDLVGAAFAGFPPLQENGTIAAGTEVVGYSSGAVAEPPNVTQEWTVDADIGLPAAADGGSYGGPFGVTVLPATRLVSAELPADQALVCDQNLETATAFCAGEGQPVSLGTSDLQIAPPSRTAAAPGTRVKLPFRLDFASSAASPPKLGLSLGSNLARKAARLRLSSNSFDRAPTDPATKRAPLTTRTATVSLAPAAKPGLYEVTLSARGSAGGSPASGTALLRVKRPLKPRLRAPRRVGAKLASTRGVFARVTMPTARSRLALRLLSPRTPGRGRKLLAQKRRTARRAGPLRFHLRLPRARALALRSPTGAKLQLRARVVVPGKKPRRLTRIVRLR